MSRATFELMAEAILSRLRPAALGHCVRIDYFDRQRAGELCDLMEQECQARGIALHILAASTDSLSDTRYISTDYVIELRNRKSQNLCLFVPTDIVDAAFSSLANSFAPIDGGQIQRETIDQIFAKLSSNAQNMVRAVLRVLKAPLGLPLDRKLAFYEMVVERDHKQDLDHLGSDLWQVGLIADSGTDWIDRLGRNRNATIQLSRPLKLQSSTVERVDSLGVDRIIRAELIKFLQHMAVNDVPTWSRSLSDNPNITLDRWVFPQEDQSDLVSVTITPFINAQGLVEKYSNLKQPDGENGLLYASYGAKESVTVRWKSDPPKPLHLHHWRVELIPANDYIADEDSEIDLPVREVSASRRSFKVSLDMELALEDLPDYPLCVRLTPLDKSGNPLRRRLSEDEPDSVEIIAHSQEFYLSNEPTPPKQIVLTSSRRATPTIAFGRIEALLDAKSSQKLLERDPQWNGTTFSLRVSDRRVINLALSPLLTEIERISLAKPSELQRHLVSLEQLRPILLTDVLPHTLMFVAGDAWNKLMSARKTFFEAIVRQAPRGTVATADWSELADPGRRYGEAYLRLLNDMVESQVSPEVLRDVLNVDTITIRMEGQYGAEEALVMLPIHPVRVAWMASYTQLLHYWEDLLEQASPKVRKTLIDMDLLRAIEPANVPPFVFHPDRAEALLNIGNLGFYYGIYLPAPFTDSERRVAELSLMLGVEPVSSLVTSDVLAAQLSKHFKTFQELHPYIDSLALSLFETHHSPWVSEALNGLTKGIGTDDDDNASSLPPALLITAYSAHPEIVTGVVGIDRLRQLFSERGARRMSDHLHPTIASTVVPLQTLFSADTDDTHLAIISDLAIPGIKPTAAATQILGMHSLSVYGLIVRLISSYMPDNGNPCWISAIALPEVLTHEHPVAPRYSNTLLDVYRAFLRAGGVVIAQDADRWPAVTYLLEQQQERLIHQIHTSAHWVITADRFFALDYYDSPQNPTLQEQSRTYLLDYAPEFADGIGRRMFITTRWRGEVELLLAAAMQELGFDRVDESVGQLLHYLKTVSGQLALQLTYSDTSAAAAVGLGIVTAYLKQRNELENGVLIPIDSAPRLFSRTMAEGIKKGERRCDLLILTMKRNMIDATFIEVKWRRGISSFDSLATEMEVQMRSTAEVMRSRYFAIGRSGKEASDERADGVLQRAYFANVVRFYVERAYRYGLLTYEAYRNFTDHLRGIERPTYEFRPKYRGFIVTLEKIIVQPLVVGEAIIEVISAADSAILSEAPAHGPEGTPESHQSTTEPISSPSARSSEITPVVVKATDSSVSTTDDPVATAALGNESADLGSQLVQSQPPSGSTPPNDEVAITLGETARGPVDWKPSVRGSPHLFIVGIPGQGKSVTTNHILVEMARQRLPALVLDFHGQFGDPTGTFVVASGSQCVDAAQGLPFSPFEVMVHNGKTDWKQNSSALADIFAYVVGLGGIQKDLLLNAIQDAYKACGYATEDTNERTLPTTEQVLKNIEQREQKQKVRNVAARCRPLLEMDLFNPPTVKSDLLAQIRQGLVIDLHDLMSETLQLATGAFVLRKLYRDMFTWGQASHLRLAIVLDEAHRLAKDVTLPKLMKEGRKYGISVVVASQGLSDFHPDILGNAGTKVIFRTNYPESRKIAPYIQPRNPQEIAARIEQLTVGSAVVQTPEMQQGVVVQMRSSEP